MLRKAQKRKAGQRNLAPGVWPKLRDRAVAMRQAPTDAESLLWKHLRNRQLNGLKFRRQHAIDRLIVDFCCIEAGLVIELDGPIHDEDPPRDETRDATLGERGFRVLRFRNEQLESNVQSVLAAIEAAAQ